MKRILFLGAARFQCPPLEYARRAGYYVITVDNVPGNPGHKLAHESHSVSTVDREKICQLAVDSKIDGILSFASDVAAPTASYVSTLLGLPGTPLEVIELLSDKARFRPFLEQANLQKTRHFIASTDVDLLRAQEFCASLDWQAVIKPVDSSGSKGVSVIGMEVEYADALAYALRFSRSGKLIFEERVSKVGQQVCGDGYMEDGALKFVQFGDGHFYSDGPPAPWGETFPSSHGETALEVLARKIEQILVASGYVRGGFNLDAFITQGGEPFVIEIGPRNGGNFIPSAIRYQTGVDLIEAAVEGALRRDYQMTVHRQSDGSFYACYMLHSRRNGIFEKVEFSPDFLGRVVEVNYYVERGNEISTYNLGNEFIANLIFSFDSSRSMLTSFEDMSRYCRPILRTR